MADLIEDILPPRRRSRVSKYPHGAPRNPERLFEIVRLRDKEKLQWRDIGPIVGMSGQGACLLYNKWKEWIDEIKKEQADEVRAEATG